jgi:hypothetical protein
MKRTLLDMTQKMFRKPSRVVLTPINLEDSTYWIYEAKGWRIVSILREIEVRETQDRIAIYLNTQVISPRDFIIENGSGGILVKFIKNRFEFEIDLDDYIEINGDIEQYA